MNLKQKHKVMVKQIKASKNKQRKILITMVGAVVAVGLLYWIVNWNYVSTEDAYINANVVQVSARIAGQIAELHVANNQKVHAGQLLFVLDPESFQVALNKAKAELLMAQAGEHNTKLVAARASALAHAHALAKQDEDNAIAKADIAAAGVVVAKAMVEQAKLDLQYTKVYAPTDGLVTNMNLRVGNTVNANQPLFALIDSKQYWVDANFKETELAHIRAGQKATIWVDTYGSHKFTGIVDSVSGGSGAAFSLLPPENATGNWVKVAQRVPVKILFLANDELFPLHIGTTATVKINTKD